MRWGILKRLSKSCWNFDFQSGSLKSIQFFELCWLHSTLKKPVLLLCDLSVPRFKELNPWWKRRRRRWTLSFRGRRSFGEAEAVIVWERVSIKRQVEFLAFFFALSVLVIAESMIKDSKLFNFFFFIWESGVFGGREEKYEKTEKADKSKTAAGFGSTN